MRSCGCMHFRLRKHQARAPCSEGRQLPLVAQHSCQSALTNITPCPSHRLDTHLVSLVEAQGSGRGAVGHQVHPQQLHGDEALQGRRTQAQAAHTLTVELQVEDTSQPVSWLTHCQSRGPRAHDAPCTPAATPFPRDLPHTHTQTDRRAHPPQAGPAQRSGRWRRPRRCWS